MRELKFRAWDKQARGWADPFIWLLNSFGKAYQWWDKDELPYADEKERFVIMQYTGLHDSKGKEIYEGDIVRIGTNGVGILIESKEAGFEELIIKAEVEFVDGAFSFIALLGDTVIADVMGAEKCKGVEVIGNVHENPELIE